MHLTELTVADFLPYRKAKLPLGPHGLVLVIGPNNAGKSALLAGLDVVGGTAQGGNWRRAGSADSARVTATFAIDDDGERGFVLGENAHPDWMELFQGVRFEWQDHTAGEMLLTSIEVASSDGIIGRVVTADYPGSGWSMSAVSRGMVFEQPPSEANWSLGSQTRSTGPLDPVAQATVVLPGLAERFGAWRESYFHFAPVRSGPSERSPLRNVTSKLAPNGANLAQVLLYQQSRSSDGWRQTTEVLNAIIPDAGEVQARAGGDEIEVVLQDPATGAALNLKRLGTGVEQVLMASYVGATQPALSVMVLEEPESGLHPGAQRLLLEHLLEWARSRLLVVSTHSTVFLDHKDPEVTRIHLVRRLDGVASLADAVDDGVEALRLVGVRLSDVASAERVLLVEGESDVEVLRAWFGSELARHGIEIVPVHGGDKAWHTETVIRVLEQADTLQRQLVFLRDRDEMSPESIARLSASSRIHLLARRELENYLLDPDAIAAALGDTTPAIIRAQLGPAADDTRPEVLLKTVVARLPPIRIPDREGVRKLVSAGANLDDLIDAVRSVTSPAALEQRIRNAWAEVVASIDREWEQRKLELAPGEEVLSAIWRTQHRHYDKKRDGPRIAAAMHEPPSELADLIASLAGR